MGEKNFIKIYFTQTEFYFSESKDEPVRISAMPYNYAANAARRLLADSDTWMVEADEPNITGHALWMIRTPLFQALIARAQGKS